MIEQFLIFVRFQQKLQSFYLFLQQQILMQKYTHSQQSTPISFQRIHQSAPSDIHKAAFSLPQTSNHNCQGSNTPVLVYLHSHNKKSLKVQLSPKISIFEIKSIIDQKIGIKKERQILYLNGKNITQYGNIHLQNLSIIHITSTDQICASSQEIHLKLTIINSVDQSQSKIYKNFEALSTQRISDFLLRLQTEMRQAFKLSKQNIQYYLLQSSRLLQKQKTFLEQNVTRQSDIICMITRNQVKTRFINDTQEEIFNDISELLGFGDQVQSKSQVKQQQESNRTRPWIQQIKNQQTTKQNHQEQSLQSTACQTAPNFKKKKTPFIEKYSQEDTSNLRPAKKLRLLKEKKDLDFLLNSHSQQKLTFQSSQTIQLQVKPEQPRVESHYIKEKATIKLPKPLAQIPKGMPVNERRKIRLQIEKLFNLDESNKAKDQRSVENLDAKEQKKPISPPTEVPRQKQKMRLSMGSRSSLVAQLRSMNLQ